MNACAIFWHSNERELREVFVNEFSFFSWVGRNKLALNLEGIIKERLKYLTKAGIKK